MSQVQNLITEHLDTWTQAIETKSSAGRGSSNKFTLVGIKKLRELILEMAVRGLLVPQDSNDEPASVLLERIAVEKAQLIKDKKIKKTKALSEISEDERTFELPDGWIWTRLGEIGNVFNGNSVSARVKTEKYEGVQGLPYIATKDVGYGFEAFDYENGINIPIGEPKFKVAHKGAILVCAEGGSAGKKCGIAETDICFGNKLFANELYAEIESKFILSLYLSPSFFERFSEAMTGIIGGIARTKFLELVVQIPPLEEQNRIVAKVDELMALCDQLEQQTLNSIEAHQILVETILNELVNPNNTVNIQQAWSLIAENFDVLFTTEKSIDTLKQTILQLAVMGKLVPQNPSDEPASKLLEKIVAKKAQLIKDKKIKKTIPLPEITEDEKPFKLPKSWTFIKLSELTEHERDISYGIIKLEDEPESGGIYVLRCSDVKPRKIDLKGCRKVSESVAEPYARTKLRGGEVLVNIRGTLGGVAVVPESLSGYNIAREVAMLPINKEISSDFIMNVIASPFFWNMIENNLKGIAYKGLNLGSLRDFFVPLPPRNEQNRIVIKVNELMSLCDQLQRKLQMAKQTQVNLSHATVDSLLSTEA